MPLPSGGIWGNTTYPDWYQALVDQHGFSPDEAQRFFFQWLATNPTGPDSISISSVRGKASGDPRP